MDIHSAISNIFEMKMKDEDIHKILNRKWDDLTDEEKDIFKNPSFLHKKRYILNHISDGEKLPDELLDWFIENYPSLCLFIGNLYLDNNIPIPDRLLHSISMLSHNSTSMSLPHYDIEEFILKYVEKMKKVPEVLLKNYYLLTRRGANIVEKLYEFFGSKIIGTPLDIDVVKNIIRHSSVISYRIGVNIYKNNKELNIPEYILKGIGNSTNLTVDFMETTGIEHPILVGILAINAPMMYIEYWLKKNNGVVDSENIGSIPKVVREGLRKDIKQLYRAMIATDWEILEEKDKEILFSNIKTLHLTLLENPELIDSRNENVQKYWIRPQKQAEEYNRIYHGIVWHSSESTILSDMQREGDYKGERELCVASIFSNRVFLKNEITLIGKTQLRMLFDFDIYSEYSSRYGKLYPTLTDDVFTEKEEIINRIDKLKKLQVQDRVEYHDEGFAMPSDTTWFAWTGPEEYQVKMKKYGYQYIPVEKFNILMQDEQVAEKLHQIYKKKYKEIETSPEEEKEEELIVTEYNISELEKELRRIFVVNKRNG